MSTITVRHAQDPMSTDVARRLRKMITEEFKGALIDPCLTPDDTTVAMVQLVRDGKVIMTNIWSIQKPGRRSDHRKQRAAAMFRALHSVDAIAFGWKRQDTVFREHGLPYHGNSSGLKEDPDET